MASPSSHRKTSEAASLRATLRARDERIAVLEAEAKKLRRQATRDTLTGLSTRRHMEDAAKRMLALHSRDPSHPVALILCDIDRLKTINDRFGHIVGDVALKRLGALIRRETRQSDMAVRLGGDEFAIFIQGQSVLNATLLAERIRAAVAQLRLPSRAREHRMTLSFGVVRHRPGETFGRLLARADRLLYQAKHRGRDRVETDADSVPAVARCSRR
ncbi:MAG: GGDEF domain-containing protein [Alphaproteobacteria bacterium]